MEAEPLILWSIDEVSIDELNKVEGLAKEEFNTALDCGSL